MYINIQNADIQMSTNGPNSISGNSDLMLTGQFEVTDADMCIERTSDPVGFALRLLAYANIRVLYDAGKYMPRPTNGAMDLKAEDTSGFPGVLNWAQDMIYYAYPEYSGGNVESIMLYPGGSFKIIAKYYV